MEPKEENKEKIQEGLTPLTEIDVRELSEVYDERDIYLSIYIPTASREEESFNETYVNSRIKAVRKALKGDSLSAFDSTFEKVREHVAHGPIKGEKGRVIFASAPIGFLHVYRIGVEPERKLVLDTSPFLLPLAKLRDDFEDYAILLMDSQEAKLFSVRSNIMKVEDSDSIDLMNKHKKGGMSQMRFNRLRRGAIHAFIMELIEDVQGLEELGEIRGILVAGPGEAKKQLLEELPQDLKGKIIGVEDISMDAAFGDLLAIGEKVAKKDEREKEKVNVDHLRTSIMKGHPSAYGAQKVKRALEQGRVNILLLSKNISIPGWICERCQNIHERAAPPEICPHCGGPTSGVDIVEELYELSQRTNAEVDFVEDSDFLSSVGGVGALLRY